MSVYVKENNQLIPVADESKNYDSQLSSIESNINQIEEKAAFMDQCVIYIDNVNGNDDNDGSTETKARKTVPTLEWIGKNRNLNSYGYKYVFLSDYNGDVTIPRCGKLMWCLSNDATNLITINGTLTLAYGFVILQEIKIHSPGVSGSNAISITNSPYTLIKDCEILNDYNANKSSYGIYLANCADCELRNLNVTANVPLRFSQSVVNIKNSSGKNSSYTCTRTSTNKYIMWQLLGATIISNTYGPIVFNAADGLSYKSTTYDGGLLVVDGVVQNHSKYDNNWLKGKIINFVGDSITKGSVTNQSDGSTVMPNPFPESIGKILECTANNYGVPGSALTDYMAKDQPIVNRCGPDKINPNAAINFLMAGTNDMTNTVELGTIGSEDSKTVYGALNIIAKTWRDQFPDTICIFCSTFRKANMVHNDNFTQLEINKAIKDVAFKFGFVFFDLYNQAPMYNPEDAVLQARWNTDSTHPNQDYITKIFADYLADRLLHLHSDMDNEKNDVVRIYVDQTNGKDYYRGKTPDTPIKNLTKETLSYCGFTKGKEVRIYFMSNYEVETYNQLEILGASRVTVSSYDTANPVTVKTQSFNFRACPAVEVSKINFDFSLVTTAYQGLIAGTQSNIFFNGVSITGSGRVNQYAIACNRCDLECSALIINKVDYIDYLVHTFASYRANCSYSETKGFWGTMSSITSIPTTAYLETSKLETGATFNKW